MQNQAGKGGAYVGVVVISEKQVDDRIFERVLVELIRKLFDRGLPQHTTSSRGGDSPGTPSDPAVLNGRGGRGGVRRTAISCPERGGQGIRRAEGVPGELQYDVQSGGTGN